MNKFVQLDGYLYEIRPDRFYRCIAKTDPFKTMKLCWFIDDPIDDVDSWESMIKDEYAEVINIEEFIEMNFEKLI
tara:strand:- start:228 stop:452 length:225 start_codon:yes stop_codon:yes gene_type:complete